MTPVHTPPDLRPLTSLRFFAALWVVVFSFWPHLAVPAQGLATPGAVAKGYLGVELFFVLSGFILSHVYMAAAGEKRFSYRGFLWARIARVYPLHLATLLGVIGLGVAATVAGVGMDANVLGWKTLPAHLTMTHAWGVTDAATFNHPSWSISAEWFAYLAFPAFAFVFWRMRERPWMAVLGAVAGMAALYIAFQRLAGFPLTQATFHWGALRIVPCFALGCALYLVYRRAPLPRAGLLALAFLVLMGAGAFLGAWDGFTVMMAGGLILALASLDNARAGWLASRPAVYLGEISYSVYMVCVPWKLLSVNALARVTGAEDKTFPLVVWLALVAGVVVTAAITYHLVEKPARTWLRALPARRKAARNSPERVLQPTETIV